MDINIIQADLSHAADIIEIGTKSFRETFGYLFSCKEELFEYLMYTYSDQKIRKSLKKENNVYFLALADNKPVGFAKVKMNSLHPDIESVSQMELQKIYVLKEYQENGAGSSLIRTVLQLARLAEPDYLWLDVHISNVKAIRFYEKHGFKSFGRSYFLIGSQTFEYSLMKVPVAVDEPCNC